MKQNFKKYIIGLIITTVVTKLVNKYIIDKL